MQELRQIINWNFSLEQFLLYRSVWIGQTPRFDGLTGAFENWLLLRNF